MVGPVWTAQRGQELIHKSFRESKNLPRWIGLLRSFDWAEKPSHLKSNSLGRIHHKRQTAGPLMVTVLRSDAPLWSALIIFLHRRR